MNGRTNKQTEDEIVTLEELGQLGIRYRVIASAFRQLTISSDPVALVDVPASATYLRSSRLEGGPVRYRTDGGTPTSTPRTSVSPSSIQSSADQGILP